MDSQRLYQKPLIERFCRPKICPSVGFYSVNHSNLIIFQPSSIHGWISAFLLDVHWLCGAIEGKLSNFLPRWLRTIGRVCSPRQNPLKYSGNWTRATGRTDSEIHSFSHWPIMIDSHLYILWQNCSSCTSRGKRHWVRQELRSSKWLITILLVRRVTLVVIYYTC